MESRKRIYGNPLEKGDGARKERFGEGRKGEGLRREGWRRKG